MISISPCFNLKVIEVVLLNCEAVILEAYGMGNIPSKNKDLMNIIERAIKRGVIIVIISQCHKGEVNDLYETGRALVEMGAVLGQDMTAECCYAKLSYLLGKGYTVDKIKRMMMTSMKGELTDIKKS